MSHSQRHQWSQPERFTHKTERQCSKCGLVKVTRHEPDNVPPHWIEWWRDLEVIPAARTPECRSIEIPAAASLEGRVGR